LIYGFMVLGSSNAGIYRPNDQGLGRRQDVKKNGSQANSSVSRGREGARIRGER